LALPCGHLRAHSARDSVGSSPRGCGARSGGFALPGILRLVDVQDWWSGGEVVHLELSGTEQGVFVRREGSGPSMTLLHGFPSSSHDWAKIAPALAERYALTMP